MDHAFNNIGKALRHQAIEMPENPTDLAYIAGILDGEGSIVFRRNKQGRRYGAVHINNTYWPLIEWLVTIGGSVAEIQPTGIATLVCYRWMLQSSEDVLIFLLAVEPYMRIKRHLAVEMIKELSVWVDLLIERRTDFDKRTRRVLRLFDKGVNPNQIAKRAGCSRQTVVRTLEREGIDYAS